ncbi:PHP domain-containing protein [Marinicellulosiphila megalodicopiae]|uniref:PHP domain-containing protein n=1 Tax=Marinicellulosiphila megalodicopiae TaxID=2724896 RepID=UPI003BB098D7
MFDSQKNYVIADLHSHSTASDGMLSPKAMYERAQEKGIEIYALTDHDTVDGYLSIKELANKEGVPKLISGIEWSTLYKGMNIHIVGLNFDANHPAVTSAINELQNTRDQRSFIIVERLQKAGLNITYEDVKALSGDNHPARPHFARYLVDSGQVKNSQAAFNKYLGAGKPGDVKTNFPSIEEVIKITQAAGGIAVFAHPHKYKMTQTKLISCIEYFKSAGGNAVELGVAQMNPQLRKRLTLVCKELELKGSSGSDFHQPDLSWCELGKFEHVPKEIEPIWIDFK